MSKKYWIVKNGESVGPFELGQLYDMNVTADTKIWTIGLRVWTPAEELPELEGHILPAMPKIQTPAVDEPKPVITRPIPRKEEVVEKPVEETEAESPAAATDDTQEAEEQAAEEPTEQVEQKPEEQGSEGETEQMAAEQPAAAQPEPEGTEKAETETPVSEKPQCPPTHFTAAVITLAVIILVFAFPGGIPGVDPTSPGHLIGFLKSLLLDGILNIATPFALVALLLSLKVKKEYLRENYEKAQRRSRQTRGWLIAAFMVAIIAFPFHLVLMML